MAVSEERLTEIAAAGGFSLALVRAWCGAHWAPEMRQWLRTAPVGEVAIWIEANAREPAPGEAAERVG